MGKRLTILRTSYLLAQASLNVDGIVHDLSLCNAGAVMATGCRHSKQTVPEPPHQHHVVPFLPSTAIICQQAAARSGTFQCMSMPKGLSRSPSHSIMYAVRSAAAPAVCKQVHVSMEVSAQPTVATNLDHILAPCL